MLGVAMFELYVIWQSFVHGLTEAFQERMIRRHR
jgi:hypothetical protein